MVERFTSATDALLTSMRDSERQAEFYPEPAQTEPVAPMTATQALLQGAPQPGYRRTYDQPDLVSQLADDNTDIDTQVSNSRRDKLSKRDLLDADNMRTIREYMIRRYGADMVRRYDSDEDLMERFVDSMRFFNGNVVGTVGEATWVADASEDDKRAAGDAYELFDRLGNMFVVDGVGGALDGIKDYVFAAARDPSSYLGLFTGGAAKAATLGSQLATKEAIQKAAIAAGQRALKSGATGEAIKAAEERAVRNAIAQIGKRNITSKSEERLRKMAAENARKGLEARLEAEGRQEFLDEVGRRGSRAAMAGAFAGDALTAAASDIAIQNTMIEVGAQEQYSALRTGIGAFAGGILAPGMQLVGEALPAALGRKVRVGEVAEGEFTSKTRNAITLTLNEEENYKVVDEIVGAAKTWKKKIEDGLDKDLDQGRIPAQFFRDVVFGSEDGVIRGLMAIFNDKGIAVPGNVRVTDFFTNLIKDLDPTEMEAITDELVGLGINLGDVTENKMNLGDLWAARVSEAAKLLQVSSSMSRTMNMGMAQAERAMQKQAEETAEKVGKEADYFGYGQSLWRRMLVSNPATSMVNVAGFAMYMGAQGIAELLSMAQLYGVGTIKKTLGMGGEKEFRQGRHYWNLVGQKMANLLDPHTTRANFEVLLDQFDAAKETLINNLSGGIDVANTRYNVPLDNPIVKTTEALANVASKITMVRAQDSVTKSMMFMAELDKRLRLGLNRTLEDVMTTGDLEVIDAKMVNQVLDDTMASVFSRNYTISENAPEVLRQGAQFVESISNLPFFGQVLPFGRFFNNVLGNTWKFGFAGYTRFASDMMKNNITTDTMEAFNRSLVAGGFFGAAMMYDKQRQEEGLGMFQVRVGDHIYDAKNSFPLSLFLLGGRMLNDEGGTGEQYMALGEQLAVGQLASDFQFGNTLRTFYNTLAAEDVSTRKKFADSLAKAVGGFAAGYTRPLDVINKAVGAATGTDYVKDARQAEGVPETMLISATKYLDNIFEGIDALIDQQDPGNIPGVTGTTLRTATREGDQRNPNSALNMLGIKQLPGRTDAESILESVDMPLYMQNIRTQNPKYDRMANIILNDVLENRLSMLKRSDRFNRMDNSEKRAAIKGQVRIAREFMREALNTPGATPRNMYMETMRKRAMDMPRANKEFALEELKRIHGTAVDLREMSYPELQQFLYYADMFEEVLKYR